MNRKNRGLSPVVAQASRINPTLQIRKRVLDFEQQRTKIMMARKNNTKLTPLVAFVNLFPNAVAHAYTFNGAGLGGAGIELIDRLTGVQSSVASSLVTNLIADPNNDFTAGVGTVLGETKRSFIEKQSLAFSDHSMANEAEWRKAA